jgi:hypothetical protein
MHGRAFLGGRAKRHKTRVGDSAQPGQWFDFLGYRFEAGRRFVRDTSLKAFKDKVRTKTIRSRGDSLGRIIGDLNPLLRGWFGYFKHARPRLFRKLDGFIRRRLRAVLRKQERRPSMGRDGPMPSSRIRGCSPSLRPMRPRDTHDRNGIPGEPSVDLWTTPSGVTCSLVASGGVAHKSTDASSASGSDPLRSDKRARARSGRRQATPAERGHSYLGGIGDISTLG